MTDEEAIPFLRKYLDDFERHARFVQERSRRLVKPEDMAADQELADTLSLRRLPVVALLRAAGVAVIPFLDPARVGPQTMADTRRTLLQAIGAYEHGMVGLKPEGPTPPPADTGPPPPASEPRAVAADDLPEMTLLTLLKTLKVRHVSVIGAAAIALLVMGYQVGLWVEKRNQELAVEKVTKERDACRSEVATLKAQPEPEPAKPAVWGK